MMKVALLVNEFPSSSETFIVNQIVGVIEAGHEVTIFAGKIRKDLEFPEYVKAYKLLERVKTPGIPSNYVLRIGKGLTRIAKFMRSHPLSILQSLNIVKYGRTAASLSLLYQTTLLLEHGPYDVLHCQFGDLGIQGVRLKRIVGGGMRLVTSFRGYDATIYTCIQSGAYEELFQEGELFLPVSHSLKKRIVEQGCPEEKIVVLPSGIDCQKFPYFPRRVARGESASIISVGRLVEKKGIAYAIEGVARVIASGRSVTYEVVGEGRLRPELEQMIEQRGMQSHIRLLGRKTHDEVIRFLENAHILVAPSITAADGDQEGIPNILKEAMAMGIPVVSTRHSGIPELVEDGVSGYLVDQRDVEALVDRLTYLIDHPATWAELGKAGRLRVETHYDLKMVNARLVELYEQLCAKM